ncbi:MAG: iron-sulfur cluster repair di-iron protein [Planctomycetes bacterium]|nr:iron-sulfur cluster repair di-iron protein [Planctomycetota bacterium]
MSASGAWTTETAVGTIVAERPETARIFELVGIDYCCGGEMSLGRAAAPLDVDPARLLRALEAVGAAEDGWPTRDWQHADLDELIEHIVTTHHVWLRRELPRLTVTAHTVLRVHGETHPELSEVVATIDEVNTSVLPHLDDEEQRVFPALLELDAGGSPDDVEALLDELHGDHDELGDSLHRLRALTRGYTPPPDACAKYREMLTGLAALEADMYTHVHLENNVLLPRARALAANR